MTPPRGEQFAMPRTKFTNVQVAISFIQCLPLGIEAEVVTDLQIALVEAVISVV